MHAREMLSRLEDAATSSDRCCRIHRHGLAALRALSLWQALVGSVVVSCVCGFRYGRIAVWFVCVCVCPTSKNPPPGAEYFGNTRISCSLNRMAAENVDRSN